MASNDERPVNPPAGAAVRRRAAAAHPGPSLSYEYVQLNYEAAVRELDAVLDSCQKWFLYLGPQTREEAFKLLYNAFWFIQSHGWERIGFLTLTIRENVVDAKEAQRRANSFQSNILQKRYGHRYPNSISHGVIQFPGPDDR